MSTVEQSKHIDLFIQVAERSFDIGSIVNIVFSSPSCGDTLKIKGVPKLIGGNRVLQFESSCTEGRVTHTNITVNELAEYIKLQFPTPMMRVDLNDTAGSASLMHSKKGKTTAVIPGALKNALANPLASEMTVLSTANPNDRGKNRLLDGSEPFLVELGISDRNGRIHDKKQAKFRQICRFSEHILDALKYLPAEGTLYIADLCCGKSYLSFAAYHLLKNVVGRDIRMTCMDLKKSVMDECQEIASRIRFDGMYFLHGDITEFVPEHHPDMVISLHACDIATDIVLDAAMRWRASVILSTPCCQRELSTMLACEPLAFIADSPILRRKFCETATDALRLLRLSCMGYNTDALEFVDPENTPKNVMLRAYLNPRISLTSKTIVKKREEYCASYRFLTGKEPQPFPVIYKFKTE